jgi:hypothetical protein
MSNTISILLIGLILSFGSLKYNGSTTAAVVLSGAIIKTQSINIDKKYKRKDCPVCKGKGFYISGDGISKVDCGYCEPDKKDGVSNPSAILKPNCISGTCNSVRK